MSSGALSLRRLFAEPGIIKCAGAHNGAGARVAEMAGFDAIWSSSFEISASYCVPDSSILSMSEHLHVAQSIADSVSIPVIADCDTGYGNAMNVTYAVKRFESSGIAGLSIEDQVFPKANSLIHGTQQLEAIS
jgi:phosphoenolpyruvate phosphomutase